jgi:predicted DNA-binding transcriptional regulator AlpA
MTSPRKLSISAMPSADRARLLRAILGQPPVPTEESPDPLRLKGVDQLLTLAEVRYLLHGPKKMRVPSSIPRVRFGHRTIRFAASAVQEWIDQHRVPGRDDSLG